VKEWTELRVDKLPEDILTGGYEWQELVKDGIEDRICTGLRWVTCSRSPYTILYTCDYRKYRYLKPEPQLIAGEKVENGDPVYQGNDGKIYNCITHDKRRQLHFKEIKGVEYLKGLPFREAVRGALEFLLEDKEE